MFGLSFFSQFLFVFAISTTIPTSTEDLYDDQTIYHDIADLPELEFGAIDADDSNFYPRFTEAALCVPQDPLEDIEWYPNFKDDPISCNDLCWSPKQDFPELEFEAIDADDSNFYPSFTEAALCVPQDPLEDIEWYPNFKDDPISCNDLCWSPKQDFPELEFEAIDADGSNFYPSFTEAALCVPQDPLEDIEWYPNFKDDPTSCNDLCWSPKQDFPISSVQSKESLLEDKREISINNFNCNSETRKKKKRRSKRLRKQHVWSTNRVSFVKGKDNGGKLEALIVNTVMRRRMCMHCMTDKTPQWRMGPKGPNTLCNACGVRYKSGRLVPEYRPLASPTFDGLKHSNFHKKILTRNERIFPRKK